MQLNNNIISTLDTTTNVLTNLFQENPILPQELISRILGELNLSSLTTLSTVNKSWNSQVSNFLQSFCNLPRWVGIKTKCCGVKKDPWDHYQVEQDKRVEIDNIVKKYFNIDTMEVLDYLDKINDNPRLNTRIHKLFQETNYHIFLIGKIRQNQFFNLEEITHDICGEIIYLENFKGQKNLQMSASSSILPSAIIKLIFDRVSSFNGLISYNKMGEGETLLRLKKIEIISVANIEAEGELKKIAELINQICQRLNQKEDIQFFESLTEEKIDCQNLIEY